MNQTAVPYTVHWHLCMTVMIMIVISFLTLVTIAKQFSTVTLMHLILSL